MANGNGQGGFHPGGSTSGVNLSFTKFLFIVPRREDEAALTKLRAAGSHLSRGFFNDFDADGTRESQPRETVQFLVGGGERHADSGIAAARYAVQVSGKYRPRLQELEVELRRRLGDMGDVIAIDGAERTPRYTSVDLYDFAYRRALQRKSGRVARNAIVLPISKSSQWWKKSSLERHTYFYPHVDAGTGCPVHGHAQTAQESPVGGATTKEHVLPGVDREAVPFEGGGQPAEPSLRLEQRHLRHCICPSGPLFQHAQHVPLILLKR